MSKNNLQYIEPESYTKEEGAHKSSLNISLSISFDIWCVNKGNNTTNRKHLISEYQY